MKESFGQRLQRLRQEAGMSQARLAIAATIPLGTLRNLEQDRRIPRLDTADALARALGVSLDTLANDSFQPTKKTRKRKGEA
jgi:transcriptional regulator with XRE-family HTH domain